MGSTTHQQGYLHIRVTIYWRTIRDYHTVFALNSLICNGFCKVNGQKHGIHLPAYRIKGRFQQHLDLRISQGLGILAGFAIGDPQPVLSKPSARASGYLTDEFSFHLAPSHEL